MMNIAFQRSAICIPTHSHLSRSSLFSLFFQSHFSPFLQQSLCSHCPQHGRTMPFICLTVADTPKCMFKSYPRRWCFLPSRCFGWPGFTKAFSLGADLNRVCPSPTVDSRGCSSRWLAFSATSPRSGKAMSRDKFLASTPS